MYEDIRAAMQEIADRAEVGIEVWNERDEDGAVPEIFNEIIKLTHRFTHLDETLPDEVNDLVIVMGVIADARKSAYQSHAMQLWHSYAAGYSVLEEKLAQLGYRLTIDGTAVKR